MTHFQIAAELGLNLDRLPVGYRPPSGERSVLCGQDWTINNANFYKTPVATTTLRAYL